METEGDCSLSQKQRFFAGIKSFYSAAIQYIIPKFPPVAIFRISCTKHYENVATLETVNDDLYDTFINYQLLRKEDIPSFVWETALVKEHVDGQTHCRIDVIGDVTVT